MNSRQLRNSYLNYYIEHDHKLVEPASLVPQNDPSTLFTSSGMQPLIPYLLGEKHLLGQRLVNLQRCFRSQDIEDIGDNRHTTFFEMLGNWSLGNYFKKDQLEWLFEYLTDILKLDPNKLYITVFSGSNQYNIPKDDESVKIWTNLFKHKGIDAKEVVLYDEETGSNKGMQGGRIFAYGFSKNWWSRYKSPEDMPVGELGGPDSEVFYEFTQVKHDTKFGRYCHPNCDCGRFVEIGNSVFMQYKKNESGTFTETIQKNVDFGGGLGRILSALNNNPDIFETDLYKLTIERIEKSLNLSYQDNKNKTAMRIIADHITAAVMLINDGIIPSNKTQGYVLRRLLRRSAVKIHQLSGFSPSSEKFSFISDAVLETYNGIQGINSQDDQLKIQETIVEEIDKFSKTLEKGLKELEKNINIIKGDNHSGGKIAFDLYQTYGLPVEITEEILKEHNLEINYDNFLDSFRKHQELSRTTSAGMFKGGLQNQDYNSIRLHTATHLLQAALREILGSHVHQSGSHITTERLRFDFSSSQKLTEEEIKEVEALVNEKISEKLPVSFKIMNKDQALNSGALGFFGEKYQDTVKVYSIGTFSKELCGGPHVNNTSELKHFNITKEESAGSGIRRIYATLEN